MTETKDEHFGTKPETTNIRKWGSKPDAPTVRTVENIDEYKIISKAFDKENRGIIMPVISADQFAAFDALTPNMVTFYSARTEKVNPKYDPKDPKSKFAIPLTKNDPDSALPPGVQDAFDFFEDFRKGNNDKDVLGYRTALMAENGYFGELVSRWLESVKSAEQKGTSGSEPRRGWSRFFLGGH